MCKGLSFIVNRENLSASLSLIYTEVTMAWCSTLILTCGFPLNYISNFSPQNSYQWSHKEHSGFTWWIFNWGERRSVLKGNKTFNLVPRRPKSSKISEKHRHAFRPCQNSFQIHVTLPKNCCYPLCWDCTFIWYSHCSSVFIWRVTFIYSPSTGKI